MLMLASRLPASPRSAVQAAGTHTQHLNCLPTPPADAPVVANPEEAERLRLLAERERQYYNKQQDGSGWADLARGRAGGGSLDASPPRRQRQRHDSPDASPPRRQRHDSPDASPPRRQRHDSPDASPPRRQRHDSPDASPPRRQRGGSPDASPPRRQRHDSPDASPPRRQRQRQDSPDASPPRRQRHDSPDASPPRRQRGGSRDASPPRQRRGASPDASPPRKRSAGEGGAQEGEDAAAKRQRMMSDGTIAGMVSGRCQATYKSESCFFRHACGNSHATLQRCVAASAC